MKLFIFVVINLILLVNAIPISKRSPQEQLSNLGLKYEWKADEDSIDGSEPELIIPNIGDQAVTHFSDFGPEPYANFDIPHPSNQIHVNNKLVPAASLPKDSSGNVDGKGMSKIEQGYTVLKAATGSNPLLNPNGVNPNVIQKQPQDVVVNHHAVQSHSQGQGQGQTAVPTHLASPNDGTRDTEEEIDVLVLSKPYPSNAPGIINSQNGPGIHNPQNGSDIHNPQNDPLWSPFVDNFPDRKGKYIVEAEAVTGDDSENSSTLEGEVDATGVVEVAKQLVIDEPKSAKQIL